MFSWGLLHRWLDPEQNAAAKPEGQILGCSRRVKVAFSPGFCHFCPVVLGCFWKSGLFSRPTHSQTYFKAKRPLVSYIFHVHQVESSWYDVWFGEHSPPPKSFFQACSPFLCLKPNLSLHQEALPLLRFASVLVLMSGINARHRTPNPCSILSLSPQKHSVCFYSVGSWSPFIPSCQVTQQLPPPHQLPECTQIQASSLFFQQITATLFQTWASFIIISESF